jgi:hypothetical protein
MARTRAWSFFSGTFNRFGRWPVMPILIIGTVYATFLSASQSCASGRRGMVTRVFGLVVLG